MNNLVIVIGLQIYSFLYLENYAYKYRNIEANTTAYKLYIVIAQTLKNLILFARWIDSYTTFTSCYSSSSSFFATSSFSLYLLLSDIFIFMCPYVIFTWFHINFIPYLHLTATYLEPRTIFSFFFISLLLCCPYFSMHITNSPQASSMQCRLRRQRGTASWRKRDVKLVLWTLVESV